MLRRAAVTAARVLTRNEARELSSTRTEARELSASSQAGSASSSSSAAEGLADGGVGAAAAAAATVTVNADVAGAAAPSPSPSPSSSAKKAGDDARGLEALVSDDNSSGGAHLLPPFEAPVPAAASPSRATQSSSTTTTTTTAAPVPLTYSEIRAALDAVEPSLPAREAGFLDFASTVAADPNVQRSFWENPRVRNSSVLRELAAASAESRGELPAAPAAAAAAQQAGFSAGLTPAGAVGLLGARQAGARPAAQGGLASGESDDNGADRNDDALARGEGTADDALARYRHYSDRQSAAYYYSDDDSVFSSDDEDDEDDDGGVGVLSASAEERDLAVRMAMASICTRCPTCLQSVSAHQQEMDAAAASAARPPRPQRPKRDRGCAGSVPDPTEEEQAGLDLLIPLAFTALAVAMLVRVSGVGPAVLSLGSGLLRRLDVKEFGRLLVMSCFEHVLPSARK